MGEVWLIDLDRGFVFRSDEYWTSIGGNIKGPFRSEYDARLELTRIWERLNRQAAEYSRLVELDSNDEAVFGWLP